MTQPSLVSMLRSRLQWHQARQKVLAENVANADMPGFRPKDLREPAGLGGGVALALSATSPLHLTAGGAAGGPGTRDSMLTETRPSGNGVDLEEEMMKVAANQSDYQLAATLYQKSLSLLRTAAGVRGSA